MKKILVVVLCFLCGLGFAQTKDLERAKKEAKVFVAEGNEVLVRDGNFPKAEVAYRKAIAKDPENTTAKYNMANSYYHTEKYDEAHQRYNETAKTSTDKLEKHRAFHNKGNTFMEQKEYQPAIEAYKHALRNNPKDDETRYNLALAKKMLEQEKQQQQQNDQNKDDQDQNKDQDQNQDQNQENKDQEGDQNKEKEDKEGEEKDKKDQGEEEKDKSGEEEKDENGDPKDEEEKDKKDGGGEPKDQDKQQPPKQVQGQLSPQQVKNLLEAMNNEEKKVQDKINAKKAKGSRTRTDKDW